MDDSSAGVSSDDEDELVDAQLSPIKTKLGVALGFVFALCFSLILGAAAFAGTMAHFAPSRSLFWPSINGVVVLVIAQISLLILFSTSQKYLRARRIGTIFIGVVVVLSLTFALFLSPYGPIKIVVGFAYLALLGYQVWRVWNGEDPAKLRGR